MLPRVNSTKSTALVTMLTLLTLTLGSFVPLTLGNKNYP